MDSTFFGKSANDMDGELLRYRKLFFERVNSVAQKFHDVFNALLSAKM